ncbi:MAG: heme-binding protein [Gemmatimonadales bacterium]|nr:heme-binding protein [Gemmatimonadales bacterium]
MLPTHVTSALSLEGARQLADAALTAARARQATIAVAVVNPAGGLLLFQMMDGTQPGSEDIAILKARSAARMRRSTKVLEDSLAAGRTGFLSLPGMLLLEGGVLVRLEGQIVGALGISGMTSVQDGEVAAAALAAVGATG